jgi:predicted nucleotidyltransferase component of viral defense system
MSLFDRLVAVALKNQKELAPLRIVVEKELLHHDILREMSNAGFLKRLTFFGGTCLRACYGSSRLSEDLDFTAGYDFNRKMLANLKAVLVQSLRVKYNLQLEVSEPTKEKGNVDTWKVKVTTRPEKKNLPLQRINIDICALPSYDRKPMTLRNIYGVDLGTSGLIIQAQSRSEILADKIIALGLRPNRIKNRDLWDIGWLKQQGINIPLQLITQKIADHQCSANDFADQLEQRVSSIRNISSFHKDFKTEMRRFLPPVVVADTVMKEDFWIYLCDIVDEECKKAISVVRGHKQDTQFRM